MTYLVGDIVTRTLRLAGIVGIGQRQTSDDAQTALDALNDILAQWQVQRWLVWSLTTTSVTSTGALSYTIGAGGTFNIPRPDRLESAFVRFKNTGGSITVDQPIVLIQSREDYNRIAVKNIGSLPQGVFYDNTYPLGSLYFWPVPTSGQYDLYITTKTAIPVLTSLTQVIAMPPEYIAALRYELAGVLRAEYTLPLDPKLEILTIKAKSIIRNANAKIPLLQVGTRNGYYNPYSDQAS